MDSAERTMVEPPSGSASFDGFISYSHAADDLLAPRLQAGLQRFAKPWWKRRAVRIFRDESSLAANPHLWSSITQALDDSSWFVLLLSEDAASSEWVGKEIEHWIDHKPSDRILPVVTDGTFGWENGDVTGSSVPPALHGVFGEEPRWVDLRFARDEESLDLQNPDFSAAVADIAATIRGIPKDELASEEVKQHRRTVRTAWAAGITVTVLAIAAIVAGVFAVGQRNDARDAQDLAQQNADRAESEAERANQEADRASANAAEATRNAQLARARELAAAAGEVREDDPELATLLGLMALDTAGEQNIPVEIGESFRRAIYSLTAVNRVPAPGGETARSAALSPDGSKLAVLSEQTVSVRVLDTDTWEELWTYTEPDSPDFASEVHFSSDGSQVAFSIVDSSEQGFSGLSRQEATDDAWARITFLDASSGTQIFGLEFEGPCPGVVLGPPSPDGNWWPVITSDTEECSFGPEAWTLYLYDAETFRPAQLLGTASPGNFAWSADSSRLSYNSFWGPGVYVYEIETGTVLFQEPDVFFGELSPDGSTVATTTFGSTAVTLWDIQSAIIVDRLDGLSDTAQVIRFSDDGMQLAAGSLGEGAVVWDLISGQQLLRLGGISGTVGMSYDDASSLLHVVGPDQIVTFDLSGKLVGEIGTELFGAGGQANSFAARGSVGTGMVLATPDSPDWELVIFDAATGEVTGASAPVAMPRSGEVLTDGRVVLFQRDGSGPERVVGPVSLWDPETDSYQVLVGCRAQHSTIEETDFAVTEAECLEPGRDWFDASRFHVDPAGEVLLVSSQSGRLLFYDATTLELLDELSTDPMAGNAGVEAFGGDWIAVSTASPSLPSTQLRVLAIPSLEEVALVPGGLVALSTDATALATHDRRGGFTIYDTTSWEPVVGAEFGEARMRGLSFSADGSKLMTSGTDGIVRIWDTQTGAELHRSPIGFSVGDGHWLDEEHLLIEFGGLWTTLTLDFDELKQLALERLTRGFSSDECISYRIDPCPTLEDMKAR